MDDLERRIRAANPSPTRRGEPLSPRAERELATLLATAMPTAQPTPLRHRRVGIAVSTIAAVLVIVTAVVTSTLLAPRPAAAAPPLLAVHPVRGDVDDVLEGLAMQARTNLAPTTSDRITAETWSADLTIVPDQLATFVQPREIVRTRDAELAGEVVTYAGEVRWGVVPSGQRPPTPGTELDRQVYRAGEYPLLFTTPPPTDATQLAAYLDSMIGADTTVSTGEYFRAVSDLRNDWALDGPQTAAVLDLLRTLPGVEVAGDVTDRLGRPGVAIATETRSGGAFRDLLIFDRATGALLSSEQVYLGGLADVQLHAPTVLDYIAWKEPA